MTRQLHLGLSRFNMESTYFRTRSAPRLYREVIGLAQYAERAGFDSFWMGEHHFSYDGYCPSWAATMASIAAATERINLTAITLLPFHNGERVSETCAALDDIAPGRARLALGLGYRDEEFLADGMKRTDRLRLYKQYLDELVGPRRQRLGDTDLWAAFMVTTGEPVQRAARHGLSLALGATKPELLNATREEYRQHNPQGLKGKLSVMRDVWVSRDPQYLAWIRSHLAESFRHYAGFLTTGSGTTETGTRGGEPRVVDLAEIDAYGERIAAGALYGTPEWVVEQIAPFVVDADIDEFVFRIEFGALDPVELEKCMTLLAEEVAPALKELR